MIRKIQGSAIVAMTLRGDRRVPYLERSKLETLRDDRIRQIVRYAARHVPYYRELFVREGIDPKSIQCAADLDRLPLIDRELVRAQPKLFLAEVPAARSALNFFTSGSTGTPLEVFHDPKSLLKNIAYGERERAAVIKVCGTGFRPKELYIGGQTSTFMKVIGFYEQNVLFPVKPRRVWMSVARPIEDVIALCDAEKPDVLVGYGGWISLFFKVVAARNLKVHLPKMIIYMAEALPHGARELIEGHFGVPVLSRYSAAESFKIGFYCDQRTGFHVHEDLCHVRIAGPDGKNVPDGEQGRIVISNLINHGSVLLNYPIGDVGAIHKTSCPCGRTFKVLSELEGRTEDILELPGERFVHPRAVWQALKDDRELLQYQLIQHEPERFELVLVTFDDAAYQRVIERAMPQIQSLLGPGSRIEAHRRPDMVRSEQGKFRAVSSRVRSR